MSELLSFDETSRSLDTPRGKLHYHVAGDGPPLLLLHGSGPGVSGWANFRGNLPVFARDYTVYVPDFPGFGKSYSPDGNPLAAGPAAVLDFLDGLGLGPVPIVGNSMGGNVAARIAAEHPERVSRLMAIGGVGLALLSPAPPEGIKLLVEFVEDPTREKLVRWMESMVYDTAILTDEFVQLRWEAATDPAASADIKKLYNRGMLEAMRKFRRRRRGRQRRAAHQDPGPDAGHVRPRRPGDAAGQRAGRHAAHPQVRAARVLRLRALGDDRAEGRVREHRARLPGARQVALAKREPTDRSV